MATEPVKIGRAEALAEAYKRGLLPPEMKSAYEEAQKRGLVGAASAQTAQTAQPAPKPAPMPMQSGQPNISPMGGVGEFDPKAFSGIELPEQQSWQVTDPSMLMLKPEARTFGNQIDANRSTARPNAPFLGAAQRQQIANERAFGQEPVDPKAIVAGMDRKTAELQTAADPFKSVFGNANVGGSMSLGSAPAIGVDPARPSMGTGDVYKAIGSAPARLERAAVEVGQSFANLPSDTANSMGAASAEAVDPMVAMRNINRAPQLMEQVGQPAQEFKALPRFDFQGAKIPIPEWLDSGTGQFEEQIMQYAIGRGLIGKTAKGGNIVAHGAKDAATVLSAFDSSTPRISEMAADFMKANGLGWMAERDPNNPIMERVKGALEELFTSVAPAKAIEAIPRGLSAIDSVFKPPATLTNAGAARPGSIDTAALEPRPPAAAPPAAAATPNAPAATPAPPQPPANALASPPAPGVAGQETITDMLREGRPASAAQPSVIPQPTVSQAGTASTGQQAGAGVGAGGGGAVPPAGPATLQATPRNVPVAVGKEELAVQRDTLKAVSRFMRGARIPRNVVNDYTASLLSRYEPLKSERYSLAFFVEDDLPQYLQSRGYTPAEARNYAGDTTAKLQGWGRAANSFNESGNSARYLIQDVIHRLTTSQKSELEATFKAVLGDETLMGRSDEIGALMRQNGEEAYNNSISEANRLIKEGKASQEQVRAAQEINAILTNAGFKEFYPQSLTIEATTRGKTVDELIQERLAADPIDTAHWLQSEIGQAARDAKNIDGSQTNMSRAYETMRKAILDRLEKFDGYKGARMQHGDLFGADEAVSFGDRFLTAARSEFKTDQMARELEKLSPRQQAVAALSIRDAMLNPLLRGSPEDAAARITELQKEGTLKALVTVLGEERGTELRNAIANMRVENQRISAISQASGSNTHLNQQGARDAIDNIRSPGNRLVHGAGNPTGWGVAGIASMAMGNPLPLVAKAVASAVDKASTPGARFQSRATKGLYGLPEAVDDAASAVPPNANALASPPPSGGPTPFGGAGGGNTTGNALSRPPPRTRAQRPPPTVDEWAQRIETDQNELQRLLKQYDQIDRADPNVDDLMRANLAKQKNARRRIAEKAKKMEAARAAQPEPEPAVPNAPQIAPANAFNAEPQAAAQAAPSGNAFNGKRALPGETSNASPAVTGALLSGGLTGGATYAATGDEDLAFKAGGLAAIGGAVVGNRFAKFGGGRKPSTPPKPPVPKAPVAFKRDPAMANLSPGDMVAYIEAKYPRAGNSISSPSPYWDAATALKRANGDRAAAAAELQRYADYLKQNKSAPELIENAERTVRAVADVDPIFFDDAAFTASMKGKAEAGGNSAMEQIRGATADDGIGGAMDVANRGDDLLPGERRPSSVTPLKPAKGPAQFRTSDGEAYEVRFTDSPIGTDVSFDPVSGKSGPASLSKTNDVFASVQKILRDDIAANGRARYNLFGSNQRQRDLYVQMARRQEAPAGYSWRVTDEGVVLERAKPAPKPPVKNGFGSSPLPMDEGARMARAKEQGFDVDTPLYHGTASDVEAFDPSKFGSATNAQSAKLGVWLTSSPNTASGYAKLAAEDTPVSKILRLADEAERKGNFDEAASLQLAAEWKERDITNNGGRGANVMPVYVRGRIKSIDMEGAKYDPTDTPLTKMAEQAKKEGYDGLKLQNFSDEGGWGQYSPTDHVLIFDPKNIRGKFAKFDPSQSSSSKLLAGLGGPSGAGAAGGGILGYALNPADANGDGVIDDLDRGLNGFGGMVSGGIAGKALGSRAAGKFGNRMKGAPRNMRGVDQNGIKAYHGSPHDFDKFELSDRTIGTGEGAQAYGHGLYFAESEGVAKSYRDALKLDKRVNSATDRFQNLTIDGEPLGKAFNIDTSYVDELKTLINAGDTAGVKNFIAEKGARWKDLVNDPEYQFRDYAAEKVKAYDGLLSRLEQGSKLGDKGAGRLYEVDIDADPEHFLDWDAPLSADHPARTALLEAAKQKAAYQKRSPMTAGRVGPEVAAARRAAKDPELTGATLHNVFNDLKLDVRTEAKLREAGIPGIKFLDQGSRGVYNEITRLQRGIDLNNADIADYSKGNPQRFDASDIQKMREENAADEAKIAQLRKSGDGTRNYVVFDDKHVNIINKQGFFGSGKAESRPKPPPNKLASGPQKPGPKPPPGYGKVRIAPGVEVLPPDRNALKPNRRKAGKAYPMEGSMSAEMQAAQKELRDARAANTRARDRFVMRDNREELWASADAREAAALENVNRIMAEEAAKRQKSGRARDTYYAAKDFINSERGALKAGLVAGGLTIGGMGAAMLAASGGNKKGAEAIPNTDPRYFMSKLKNNADDLAAVQNALVKIGLLKQESADAQWGQGSADGIAAYLASIPDRNPKLPLQEHEVLPLLAKAYGGYEDENGKWFYNDGQPIKFPIPSSRGSMPDRPLSESEARRMQYEKRLEQERARAQ